MPFDPTKPATVVQPAPTEVVPSAGFDPTKPATVISSPSSFDPTQPATVIDVPRNPRFAELEKEKGKYSGWFDVVRPEAREAIGGYWNALFGKDTPDEDIKAVAEELGTDFETLRLIAPFLHAVPPKEQERPGDFNMRLLGTISAVGGDIPQFLAKKLLTDDPKLREAMDYIRELGEERTGLAEWTIQNLAPVGLAAKGLKTAAKAIGLVGKEVAKEAAEEATEKAVKSRLKEAGKGAAVGAAFGLGGSREGEEVESTLQAAAVGAVLPGALDAVTAGAKKVKNIFYGGSDEAIAKTDPATKEAVLEYAKNNEADITASVDVLYEASREVEDAVKKIALDKKDITLDDAQRIVDELMTPDQKRVAELAIVDKYIKANKLSRQKEVAIPEGVVTSEAIAQEYIKYRTKSFADKLRDEVPDLATIMDEKKKVMRPASDSEVLREAERLGKDELASKWDDQLRENLAYNAIRQEEIKLTDTNQLGKIIANGIGGRQFGVNVIDERTGIDAIMDFNLLNVNTNKAHGVIQQWRRVDRRRPDFPTLGNVYKAAKKVPQFIKTATSDEDNKIYRALTKYKQDETTGELVRDLSGLTPDEKRVAQKVADFFDQVVDQQNATKGEGVNPMNIPKRKDFGLPDMPVEPTQYVIKLKNKLSAAERSLGPLKDLRGPAMSSALQTNKDLQDLVAGMRLIDAKDTDAALDSGKMLLQTLEQITSGAGRTTRLYKVAGTALARRGSIPDYLKEKNVFRLMDRYMTSIVRNTYTRRPLEQLAYKAKVLDKMGLRTESEFIKRIIQDQYGIRAWSASKLFGEAQIVAADLVNKTADKLGLDDKQRETLQRVVAYIPEAISSIQYNIYPNVLGMNGKSHITNLASTLTKGAPELGGTYGLGAVAKAFLSTPVQFSRLLKQARDWGLAPEGGYTKEYQEALESGLGNSTGWQYAKSAYENFAKAWMWSYQKIEDFNRAAIVNMGEMLAKDAANGNRGALRAIRKMPLPVRRAYAKAAGNLEEQAKILARNINDRTAYNYNKASLNEVGVHLGPFFATFTKWPTETVGDILADIRTKGLTGAMPRILEKYAAIWAMAQALDSGLYYAATGNLEAFPEFDKSTDPVLRYWLGKAGLSGWAPIGSVEAVIPVGKDAWEKGPYTPAVIHSLWNDILLPLSSLDDEKIQKGFVRATQTFFPGGGTMRFLMRDIPMGVLNEEQIQPGD